MGAVRSRYAGAPLGRIHSTRLHLALYSFLLVATPFVLLRNFLVDMIGKISGTTLPVAGQQLPVVPLAAFLLLAAGMYGFRSQVTRLRLIAVGVVVVMDTLAQQITDYYFGHHFYDLQQNWHYIAYGLFAFMAYRDFRPRGYSLARILWTIWLAGLAFSCFDEIFQMKMSARVFDPCDIAKDSLGTCMGMVLISLGSSQSDVFLRGMRRLSQTTWSGLFRNPFASLLLMFLMTFLLLNVSSLLTDTEHLPAVALITFSLWAVLLLLAYVLLFKTGRRVLLGLLAVAVVLQGISLVRHRDSGISQHRFGLTVYRGVPLPFFDVLIHGDGSFRLVDKKHYFNLRDQDFFLKQRVDIVIVGSGDQGKGGRGFPGQGISHFQYNPHLHRATQFIIQSTPEACRTFNRLKQERKNVILVVHNTC